MSIGHGAFVRSHNVKPATPIVRMDLCRSVGKKPRRRRKGSELPPVVIKPRAYRTPEELLAGIAEDYGLVPDTVLSPGRSDRLVRARKAIIWGLRGAFPDLSSVAIGHVINRHHTTVLEVLGRRSRTAKERRDYLREKKKAA